MDYASRPRMAHEHDGSTLERPRIETRTVDLATVRLEVVAGPDIGKTFELDPDAHSAVRVFAGKSTACELALSDELVSRRHCAFELDGSGVRLTDLDSTNGTTVNGVRALAALLFGGELVRIGDTTIAVRFGDKKPRRLPGATRFGRVLGTSPEMTRLYPVFERLARADVPVILEGETGTGKEVLAEALHEASPRASGPFVVFDCTTSPAGLLESRLFGHERGAFTGAVASRPGVFEDASGGTLLIDEIGDLDIALQAKLLRAVQSGQVQRLGGSAWIKTNVRIIAATRRDLEREIQAGRFRDDLYFRLAVARVEIPPLRRRTGDIRLLAEHFWSTAAKDAGPIPEDLVARFESYAWPGNVRELFNAVAHHAALGELADLGSQKLSAASEESPKDAARDVVDTVIERELPFTQARDHVMRSFEERYVDAMLAKHDGNISKAAAAAGIARRYFYTIRTRRGR